MRKIAPAKIRLPKWFRQTIPEPKTLQRFLSLKKQGVNTVCLEARCPNWACCLRQGTLAFMILGNCCTRNCRFCAVEKSKSLPLPLDREEPYRILKIIKSLKLNFVIITSVSRDDLLDYGAGQFVRIIRLVRNYNKDIKIEVLIPDFIGTPLKKVVLTKPDVLAHNIETVPRLYPRLRREANYQRSLMVLSQAKRVAYYLITKSSLLLGMGEREGEIIQVMKGLRDAQCDILVLGQYLAPTVRHYPVKEFVSLKQFQIYKNIGMDLGFRAVLSSPLARTSYRAEEVYNKLQEEDNKV